MHVKKTSDREPYQITITEKEMKEAFRNPVTYELFRQALISQILGIYYQARDLHTYDIDTDPLKDEKMGYNRHSQ